MVLLFKILTINRLVLEDYIVQYFTINLTMPLLHRATESQNQPVLLKS
jgi:hypothetical protein